MHSYTDFLPSGFQAFLEGSYVLPRAAIIGLVVVFAVVVGPRGLAVGPSQTRSMSPALPTGAAMETDNVLGSISLSFDLIQISPVLERHHASYPETTIGPLSFPEGAINVPWTPTLASPRDDIELDYTNTRIAGPAGNTVSAPSSNGVPQILRTATHQPVINRASVQPTRIANGPMDNGDWRSVVIFDRTGTDLSRDALASLDAIARGLSGTGARIQLLAFGGEPGERTHTARRLALRRALAVRNHLMQSGVEQEQISVLAQGGAEDGGPMARVDVIIPRQ